ncbi:hypothetical protein FEDK69T_04200 [Flavobacterium enshiense DK69]|uniref:Secretion system C-terminal sorting domain-containing protein n=1 Tax=Flavobacterium enshiense DK69 TaxID=1107311 RepID=V6SF28_9FLAO|nr:T9SS type A sorting domain-containing protein [Flavobacterium enshiense]ESU24867.1 hypothetical protein FEDK69T_04200 [Flavobacterium enshiense DK69]KGO96686.1 hypothetical protein Q767_02965 [Flavobacterium enshiense DK69]
MRKIIFLISFLASIIGLAQDGSLDTSFKVQGSISPDAIIKLQSDGKIIVVERFYNGGDFVEASKISRLNSNGSVDMSFATGTGINLIGEVRAVVIQSNGRILIGGRFRRNAEETSNIYLAGISSNGSLDFIPFAPGIDFVESIAVQPDGKILVGGYFPKWIARINPLGGLDPSFNSSLDDNLDYGTSISNIVLRPDNKILAIGYVTIEGGHERRIFSLNSNGELNNDFQEPSNIDWTYGDLWRPKFLALEKNGNILIAWPFRVLSNSGDEIGYNFVRLDSNGNVITVFQPLSDGALCLPHPVGLQEDGKIIMAGSTCTYYNGYNFRGIARLNIDGSIDETFDPRRGLNGHVECVAIQPDGKILISGYFTVYNEVPVNHIIRLNSTRLSNSEFNSTAMRVYPNPVADNLHIQLSDNLNGADISELEIYDITMKKIDFNMPSKDVIDVSDFSSGVYLLKVKTDDSIFTSRFVKN